jgi:hypothetical protein
MTVDWIAAQRKAAQTGRWAAYKQCGHFLQCASGRPPIG